MSWITCYILMMAVLVVSIILAIARKWILKEKIVLSSFNIICIGVFLAIYIGLLPIVHDIMPIESKNPIVLIMLNAVQTIQVFTINEEISLAIENIRVLENGISDLYSTTMSCLFFIAPLFTFGFLISLFKNVISKFRYYLYFWKDTYILSELNDKSLLLAQNIKEEFKNALIIFTNVDKEEGEVINEQLELANKLQCIIFQNDIATVDFSKHSKSSKLTFFTIGDDEEENLILALKLIERYKARENTNLYVFSSGKEGELLLSNVNTEKMKVRRVDEVRSVIYHFLYDCGNQLFIKAQPCVDKKKIFAVIAGLGKYGKEMLKALSWFLQMDGYVSEIHVFDKDELAEAKFSALCPELMSEKINKQIIEGDSQNSITIHSGVDISTKEFADFLSECHETSFVFVCLGDDEDNINQAANIRMYCERAGCNPLIETIVYNDDEKKAIKGLKNYRKQNYNIESIGDLKTTTSIKVIMGSELEKIALAAHLKWGEEEDFWQYEYNYRSSMASAIHQKARMLCGMLGASKKECELTVDERDSIEILEHKRWNAYMRSEGYVYSGDTDKSSRNDLAKMHHNIVPFVKLSEEDKRKDSRVATK